MRAGRERYRALSPTIAPVPRGEVVLGRIRGTEEPYALPFAAFQRGAAFRGGIGSGKTTLARRFLYKFGLAHAIAHFDYAGTGDTFLRAWIALIVTFLAAAGRRNRRMRTLAQHFVTRYAFGVVDDGVGVAMPIRINLLKKRRLAHGALESVQQVVDRVFLVMDAKLNTSEPQIRVRFRRVARAILTALVAGERRISEALLLLDDPGFASFTYRAIEARTLAPEEALFVAEQLRELRSILATHNPAKPGSRVFNDLTESTRNAFYDFAPGTPLGRFFGSDETFAPESLAFGAQGLSLSTTLTDPVIRAQLFQAVHGMLHGLLASRTRTGHGYPPVTVMSDEILWYPLRISEYMATSRNLNVSYISLFQHMAQWKDIGMETMPDKLGQLANLMVTMRPDNVREAEEEVARTVMIRPDGLVQRFFTTSTSASTSVADAVSETWSDFESENSGESEGEAESTMDGWSNGRGSSSGASEASQWNDVHGIFDSLAGNVDDSLANRFSSGSNHSGASGGSRANQWSTSDFDGTSGGSSYGTHKSTMTGHTRGTGRGTGKVASTGSTRGTAESEVLNVVDARSQLFLLAQEALRRPPRTAHVLYDGVGREIELLPPVEYPTSLCGVPILERFVAQHDQAWEARAVRVVPYDPSIVMTTPEAVPSPAALVALPPAAEAVVANDALATTVQPSFTRPRSRRRRPRPHGGQA